MPAPRESSRPSPLARALGTESVLAAVVLGGAAALALHPIMDPDVWWHMAGGRYVLEGHGVPWTDPFSYVAGGRPWLAYSWLAEVLFAGLHAAFGPGALVLLSALLVVATTAVVLRTCRAAGARPAVAAGATLAVVLVSAPSWTVRPHLFSFLCMAVFSHVLVLDRTRRASPLWLLVPTMALWANTHILFPYGLALLGLHVLTRDGAWWRGAVWRRVGLGAAVGAATLATPFGWHLLEHVLVVARQGVAFEFVSEFQTPSLHAPLGFLLTLFLFATLLALVYSPARREPVELADVFLFAFLAYWMARNVPFFAIVAAPVLARHVDALLPRQAPARPPLARPAMAVHAAVLLAGGALLAGRAIGLAAPGAAIDPEEFPVEAVRFLDRQPSLGRLMNDFDWGGYLIWHLYPRYRVSMDPRVQVQGPEALAEYRAMDFVEPGWRAYLERCDPDVVLWPRRGAFARVLELLPEWKRLYQDDRAVIFVRRDAGSRAAGRAAGA